MSDFIYQRETAPCGVAVEEIYGADEKSPKVWKLFAMQIFSEAEGEYRSIEHLDNGAPVLDGASQRISVSHTPHFLAVASLPRTPEIALDEVNARSALGIDIEKADRSQVIKVRDKFLSDRELAMLPAVESEEKATPQEIKEYIAAWTCKEALYKAAMGTAGDWKEDYRIITLPKTAGSIAAATPDNYGKAEIRLSETETMDMLLSSWVAEGHIITLAFSPKIARFPRQ